MSESDDWGDSGPEPVATSTSKLCIAALVLGLMSPVCCGVITAIPAVICGHMGMSAVGDGKGPLQGRGMAIAGLVLGYLSIVLTVGWFLLGGADALQEMIDEAVKQAEQGQ